jgi:hypothetical protein
MRKLEEQDATACVGCGTIEIVTTSKCIRCDEDIRSCDGCDVTSCDWCRHMSEKDD